MVPSLLKILPKLIGNFSHIVITPSKELLVQSMGNTLRVKLKEDIEGLTEPINIPFAALNASLLNKPDPTLQLKGGAFTVTDKGYRADLNYQQQLAPIHVEVFEGDLFEINPEVCSAISSCLPALMLDKIHSNQLDPLLSVSFSAKKIFLGVNDRFQLAFTTTPAPDGSPTGATFQMPYGKAVSLFKESTGSTLKLIVTDEGAYVKVKLLGLITEMSMSWPKDDQAATVEAVMEKAKSISGITGAEIKLEKAAVQQFLENSRAISADDTRVKFHIEGKVLIISAESSSGKMKAKIPLEYSSQDTDFILEHRFVNSLMKKLDDQISLIYSDGMLKTTSSKLSFVTITST